MKQVSSSFITNIFLKNNIQKQALPSFKGQQNPRIDNEESQKKYDEAITSIGKAQVKIGKKKADEDYIVELARQGVSALKISEQTGHSKKYVSDILKKYDIKTPFMLRQEMLNSPEFIERVVTSYKDGKNVTEIAQQEGVPLGTITSILNKAGIKTTRQQIKEKVADKKTRQEIIKMSETMSIQEIAKKTGIPVASVTKILEESNSKTPMKKSFETLSDKKVIKNIVDKFNSGKTPQQIADEIGVHKKSVVRILNREGIKTAYQQRMENANSAETRKKIIDMATEGKNTIEIAKEVDASLRLVSGILQQENIPTEFQEKLQLRFDTDIQQRVIELVESGKSARQIEKSEGIPKSTIHNILKKAGIKTKAQMAKERANDPEYRKFIITMYKRGASIMDIERSTECSHALIKRILEAEGAISIEINNVSLEVQKQVIELAKKGCSIAAIEENLANSGINIGYHIINKILTNEGIRTENQKVLNKTKSKSFQNEVITKFKNGESIKKISEDLGVSGKAVVNILNNNGFRTEQQYYQEKANDPEIIKLVIKRALEGASCVQIANETGIAVSSVFSILTENNIQTKRKLHNENIDKTELPKR